MNIILINAYRIGNKTIRGRISNLCYKVGAYFVSIQESQHNICWFVLVEGYLG